MTSTRRIGSHAGGAAAADDGTSGLFGELVSRALEAALDAEMTEHLGYRKHSAEGRDGANSRNGRRTKRVVTRRCGTLNIAMPRDRHGTFTPTLIVKRQRRFGDIDDVILTMFARFSSGSALDDIAETLADRYEGVFASDAVHRIGASMVQAMAVWAAEPLDNSYWTIQVIELGGEFHAGDGGALDAAVALAEDGTRRLLGLWTRSAEGGSSPEYWLALLMKLWDRGVREVSFVRCQGLTGCPEGPSAVFPTARILS